MIRFVVLHYGIIRLSDLKHSQHFRVNSQVFLYRYKVAYALVVNSGGGVI